MEESESVTIDEGTLEFVELGLYHTGYFTCRVKCNDKYVDSQTVKVRAVSQIKKEGGQCLFRMRIQCICISCIYNLVYKLS